MTRIRFLCSQSHGMLIPLPNIGPFLAMVLFCFPLLNPTAQAQDTKAKELVGKVVDEKGKPLAGAQVFWANFTGDETSTSSEADGRFQIQLKHPAKAKTQFFLWVYLPGYNLKAVQPRLGGDQWVRDCTVALEQSQTLVVQVLDDKGSPCRGAKLTPLHYDLPNGVFDSDKSTGLVGIVPPGIANLLSATSNESGNTILRGLKKDFLRSVQVKYGDWAAQTHSGSFRSLRCKVQLAPVATIRGKINVDDLSPLADRKLRVSTKCPNPQASQDDPFSASDGPTSFVECIVATDGSFEAKNVGAGNFSIIFGWDANCPKQLKTPEVQKVASGEDLVISLDLAEAVKVRGKLVKEDTNEPVASCGVHIDFGPKNAHRFHSLESNKNGEFEAYVLPGEVEVQAFDASKSPSEVGGYGYPEVLRSKAEAGNETIDLPPLKFYKQAEAKVLVVDTNGNPLPNRFISRIFGNYGLTDAHGTTDDQGVATVIFRRRKDPIDFSGEWVISDKDQSGKVDRRKLPRLTLKQSSPPIFQYKKPK